MQREREVINSADSGYDSAARARWRPSHGYSPEQAGSKVYTQVSNEALCLVVQQLGDDESYFLWQIRARMDDMIGNGVIEGRPPRDTLALGDMIDF